MHSSFVILGTLLAGSHLVGAAPAALKEYHDVSRHSPQDHRHKRGLSGDQGHQGNYPRASSDWKREFCANSPEEFKYREGSGFTMTGTFATGTVFGVATGTSYTAPAETTGLTKRATKRDMEWWNHICGSTSEFAVEHENPPGGTTGGVLTGALTGFETGTGVVPSAAPTTTTALAIKVKRHEERDWSDWRASWCRMPPGGFALKKGGTYTEGGNTMTGLPEGTATTGVVPLVGPSSTTTAATSTSTATVVKRGTEQDVKLWARMCSESEAYVEHEGGLTGTLTATGTLLATEAPLVTGGTSFSAPATTTTAVAVKVKRNGPPGGFRDWWCGHDSEEFAEYRKEGGGFTGTLTGTLLATEAPLVTGGTSFSAPAATTTGALAKLRRWQRPPFCGNANFAKGIQTGATTTGPIVPIATGVVNTAGTSVAPSSTGTLLATDTNTALVKRAAPTPVALLHKRQRRGM